MINEISQEKANELAESDLKLQILNLVIKSLDNDLQIVESRPNLDIYAGTGKEVHTSITLNHPEFGSIEIRGINLLK